jgi:hypothetical protein
MALRKDDLPFSENAKSQIKKLLWYFQNINSSISISTLKRRGFTGPDGKHCMPLSPCQRINELRNNGWVIITDRNKPTSYIFKGHFDAFDEAAQKVFITDGSVYPSRRERLED